MPNIPFNSSNQESYKSCARKKQLHHIFRLLSWSNCQKANRQKQSVQKSKEVYVEFFVPCRTST